MTERRAHKDTCELRQGPNGPMLVGYAARFDRDSENLGGFIEQVDKRAFDKTLGDGADVVGLFNHDTNQILGRSSNGTLRLSTDDNGLRYEIDINPEDPMARSVHAKIERRDVRGSSFAFEAVRQEWNWDARPAQRRLLEVALVDVGPVTNPAYRDSSVVTRALEKVAGDMEMTAETLAEELREGRAVWSTSYVNDLPDSAFLYIEPGGEKDSDGKTTPRTLRHFPYKDASGAVDLPHLRNALARIPQSNLPADVKASATAKAEKILNAQNQNQLESEAEERVGKTISAATAAKVRKIILDLENLVATDPSRQPTEEDYENEEQVDDQRPSHDGEVIKILRFAEETLAEARIELEESEQRTLTKTTAAALVEANERRLKALRITSQAA